MKKLFMLMLVLTAAVLHAQDLKKDFPQSFAIKVTNPGVLGRGQVLVLVSPAQLKQAAPKFNFKAFVVIDGAKEISSQYNHAGADAGIAFVLDTLAPSASRTFTIRFHPTATIAHDYPKRTQAELSHKVDGAWQGREYMGGKFQPVTSLRVPPEHKDHSWFIRYEGPGWESDKVGYRFYLDQRNATDVFGKKTKNMVLQQVGLDGFESYHHLQPWGMDVMKVGKAVGLGSPAILANGQAVRIEKTDSVSCRISENGVVYSAIQTHYAGWQVEGKKYDVNADLSIHAGTRLSHLRLTFSQKPEQFCTGIVKDKAAPLVTKKGDDSHWGYMATFGKQSLNDDNLGLAVFFRPKDEAGFTADPYSHLVQLKPANTLVEYYFLAAWSGEPGGIQTEQQFYAYLNGVAAQLAEPIKVTIGM
ncbi:DUF4861 family protein [Fulvivirgaceae bacterium PWU5]|uniref:DUF4861 family protein n=1 Tax=Dawidia cretensis TaxID=2782350 RepID=A0AAP2E3G9_9BACT|nr:DUF4861 domain-containing protein [Dawidia cretensis]MBT1711047.1 DUF4861 family protein [Dawidia cretensis]